MLLYCLKSSKKIDSKDPRIANANKGKLMILLKCAVYDSKKLTIIKEQEANGLLSSLGIKIPLSKILLVGPLLF